MMVAMSMFAFDYFFQILITQQNRVAGTISHSSHFVQVQYQLMNRPLSYEHDI